MIAKRLEVIANARRIALAMLLRQSLAAGDYATARAILAAHPGIMSDLLDESRRWPM